MPLLPSERKKWYKPTSKIGDSANSRYTHGQYAWGGQTISALSKHNASLPPIECDSIADCRRRMEIISNGCCGD